MIISTLLRPLLAVTGKFYTLSKLNREDNVVNVFHVHIGNNISMSPAGFSWYINDLFFTVCLAGCLSVCPAVFQILILLPSLVTQCSFEYVCFIWRLPPGKPCWPWLIIYIFPKQQKNIFSETLRKDDFPAIYCIIMLHFLFSYYMYMYLEVVFPISSHWHVMKIAQVGHFDINPKRPANQFVLKCFEQIQTVEYVINSCIL